MVSPAARVLRVGENRFPFGVFTVGREQITGARGRHLRGPRRTSRAPRSARSRRGSSRSRPRPPSSPAPPPPTPTPGKAIYVSDIPLDKPGAWTFAALVKEGDGFTGTVVPAPSQVGQFDPVDVGDKAPSVSTPTADEVNDIAEIDTRVPASTMHDVDLQDVLGKKPVVLSFATPALCQSRICGPVIDVAEQVKRDAEVDGRDVAFIHQEIYNENDINKGTRPQVERLPAPERALALRDRPRRQGLDGDRGRLQRRGAPGRSRQGRARRRLLRKAMPDDLLQMLATETDRRAPGDARGDRSAREGRGAGPRRPSRPSASRPTA